MVILVMTGSLSLIPGILAQTGPEFTEAANGLPTEGDYSYITMADMDGDGNEDIISGADAYGGVDTYGLHVFTGDGTGSWTESSNGLPTTENFGGLDVGDLDGDGDMDIVAGYETWSGSDGLGVGVWLGNGAPGSLSFTGGTVPTDSGGYDSAVMADVDGDGNLDVLGASRGKGIKVWLGNGGSGGSLQWTEASEGLPTSGEHTGITADDIDGDGDLDIAAGNYNGHGIQVWTRNGDGSWTEASEGLWDRDNSFCVVFEDFDKDGNLDLAATVRGRGIFVWTGNGGQGGSVQWTESKEGLPSDGRYKQIDVGDIDGDGNLDLVAARPNGGIYLWKGNGGSGGALSFTEGSGNLPTDGTFYGASFGNIDGDQVPDVVGATWDSGLKAWTTALGPADDTPPAAVDDLQADAVDHTTVELTWTATGDDGNSGTATGYDIRYSTSEITGMDIFEAAFVVNGEPSPQEAGTSQSHTVTGLSANRTYYFAMLVGDDGLNPSDLSNVASVTTPEAPSGLEPPTVTVTAPVVPNGEPLKGTVEVTIDFSDPDADVNELEIFVDGKSVKSVTGMTSPYVWEWDTASGTGQVEDGSHTVKVTVTDSGGFSDSDEVTVEVKNKERKKENENSPGFDIVVLLLASLVGLMLFGRRGVGGGNDG